MLPARSGCKQTDVGKTIRLGTPGFQIYSRLVRPTLRKATREAFSPCRVSAALVQLKAETVPVVPLRRLDWMFRGPLRDVFQGILGMEAPAAKRPRVSSKEVVICLAQHADRGLVHVFAYRPQDSEGHAIHEELKEKRVDCDRSGFTFNEKRVRTIRQDVGFLKQECKAVCE